MTKAPDLLDEPFDYRTVSVEQIDSDRRSWSCERRGPDLGRGGCGGRGCAHLRGRRRSDRSSRGRLVDGRRPDRVHGPSASRRRCPGCRPVDRGAPERLAPGTRPARRCRSGDRDVCPIERRCVADRRATPVAGPVAARSAPGRSRIAGVSAGRDHLDHGTPGRPGVAIPAQHRRMVRRARPRPRGSGRPVPGLCRSTRTRVCSRNASSHARLPGLLPVHGEFYRGEISAGSSPRRWPNVSSGPIDRSSTRS